MRYVADDVELVLLSHFKVIVPASPDIAAWVPLHWKLPLTYVVTSSVFFVFQDHSTQIVYCYILTNYMLDLEPSLMSRLLFLVFFFILLLRLELYGVGIVISFLTESRYKYISKIELNVALISVAYC